jgi:hypothetical protein
MGCIVLGDMQTPFSRREQSFASSIVSPVAFGNSVSNERKVATFTLLYEYLTGGYCDDIDKQVLLNYLLDGNLNYVSAMMQQSVDKVEDILCDLAIGFERFCNTIFDYGFTMDMKECIGFVKNVKKCCNNEGLLCSHMAGGLDVVKILEVFLENINVEVA